MLLSQNYVLQRCMPLQHWCTCHCFNEFVEEISNDCHRQSIIVSIALKAKACVLTRIKNTLAGLEIASLFLSQKKQFPSSSKTITLVCPKMVSRDIPRQHRIPDKDTRPHAVTSRIMFSYHNHGCCIIPQTQLRQ